MKTEETISIRSLGLIKNDRTGDLLKIPSCPLKLMSIEAPVDPRDFKYKFPRDLLKQVVTAKNLSGDSDMDSINSAVIDDIIDKLNIGSLGYKFLLYLIYELSIQSDPSKTFIDNIGATGATEAIARWLTHSAIPYSLTPTWGAIVLDEIETTKAIYQTDKPSKQLKESIFRPTPLINEQKKTIRKKGVLYRLADLFSYRKIGNGSYAPYTYIKVSPPLIEKETKRYYIVEISPVFAGITTSHFSLMRKTDLTILFKGKHPSMLFKLYSHLLERNRSDAKNNWPKYNISTKKLLSKIASQPKYTEQPSRILADFEHSISVLKNIGLLAGANLDLNSATAEFLFKKEYANSSENSRRSSIVVANTSKSGTNVG